MGGYQVTGSIIPDKLLAGTDIQLLTKVVNLKSGQGLLKRGTILGIIDKSLSAATFAGTGNGTMTAVSLGKDAILGNYKVKCITEAVNGGAFSVIDPNGNRLGDAVVGTAYVSSQIKFTINDGATDFIVGDTFTIPVAAGDDVGKGKLCDANSVDGSQKPQYVLIADTDTTADVKTAVYKTGYFNRDELIYGTNGAPSDAEVTLKTFGIHLSDQIAY